MSEFPKCVAAKMLPNSVLQLRFDNGETRLLHTHFIGEIQPKFHFFGLFAGNAKSTKIKLQPDGSLILNETDIYSPEELWNNSKQIASQPPISTKGEHLMKAIFNHQAVPAWKIEKDTAQPDWVKSAFENKQIWWAEPIQTDFSHNVGGSWLKDAGKTVYRTTKNGKTLVIAGTPENYGQLDDYLLDLSDGLKAVSADEISISPENNSVIFGSASNVDVRYGAKAPSRSRSADKNDRNENPVKIDWQATNYAVLDGQLVRFWHKTFDTPDAPDWLNQEIGKDQVAILHSDKSVTVMPESQALQALQPIAPIEAAIMTRPKVRDAKLLKVKYGYDTAKAWQISLDEEPVGWVKHAFDVRAINWNRMPGGKVPYLEARGFYTGIPLGIEGAYLILNADNYLLVSQKEFAKTYKVLGEEA